MKARPLNRVCTSVPCFKASKLSGSGDASTPSSVALPAALRCEAAIAAAVEGKTDVVCAQSPWPIGEPNTAYAQYFIGNSYLAPMEGGMANVTFEPGCRNNWHIHHNQVQVLVCVSGRGWYQEWGKEPVALVPGVVIAILEGVKHWHGAAADSWMQHLTYHTDVKPNASNEWLEAVDDEWYGKLK